MRSALALIVDITKDIGGYDDNDISRPPRFAVELSKRRRDAPVLR